MAHFSGDASFLGLTSERELNAHIDRELQMTESDRARYNQVLDGLYRTLQTEVRYNNLTVNRMVKGGSYGRGTALKDRSDLDVVLFFNGIPSMRDFLAQQSRIIGHVATTLERSRWARENGVFQVREQQNAATLSLKLSGGHQMDVDIVPAFDNLGPLNEKRKREEVYRAMRGDPEPPYKYSASFIGLQVDFVRDRPARLKNLIRVVKSWKKEQDKQYGKLGSSWLWELITIHVWENKLGRRTDFNMGLAFKRVMETVTNHSSLKAWWNMYYDGSERLSTSERPLVLDPANPWHNVASSCSATGWGHIQRAARGALQSSLLKSL